MNYREVAARLVELGCEENNSTTINRQNRGDRQVTEINIREMFVLSDSFFMSRLSDVKKGAAELMSKHNAFVDPHSDVVAPNWTTYIEGYKNAADYLVEHAVKEWPVDMLVYPIVFLYRQYLELQLKDLLQVLYKCHGLSCNLPNTHDLVIQHYCSEG